MAPLTSKWFAVPACDSCRHKRLGRSRPAENRGQGLLGKEAGNGPDQDTERRYDGAAGSVCRITRQTKNSAIHSSCRQQKNTPQKDHKQQPNFKHRHKFNIVDVFFNLYVKNIHVCREWLYTLHQPHFAASAMSIPVPIEPTVKASVAMSLLGLELNNKRLMRLSGSEKPEGQRQMKYKPQDMLNIRARLAGISPETVKEAMVVNTNLPAIIVTRMTKGGIGKTSITVNLATALALSGYRVLLIDADPQASATNMLGIETESYHEHIGKLLLKNGDKPDDLRDYIIPIFEGGFLDLIPSDVELDSTNPALIVTMGREQKAEEFVTRNKDFLSKNYDVILVDTTPGTTPVSVAFTYLAHLAGKVLTVVEPEGSCLRALDALQFNLEEIQKLAKRPIDLAILVNKAQIGRKHVEHNYAILAKTYPNRILPVQIPHSIAFTRQIDADDVPSSMPVLLKDPNCKAADSLYRFARMIASEFNVIQPGFVANA